MLRRCDQLVPAEQRPKRRPQMPRRRFDGITMAQLSGCAIVFAAWLFIENAHAQPGYVPPPTPLPPPVFNPSNPYTVPQPSYRPITPTTPSADPGYVVTPPTNERLPHTAARSHPRPQSQDRARSTTGPAPQSFVQRRRLIPTITRPSDMAMVA